MENEINFCERKQKINDTKTNKQTNKQILYPSADLNQAKNYSPYSITVIIKATTNKSNILHLSSIVIEVVGTVFILFFL